jgi:hypothetical protein
MVQLFSDQLRDARAGRAKNGVARTWMSSLTDLATTAVGEHLRKDRSMAQSLATFEPTRTMRLLGLLGLAGGTLLLWAFVSLNPFADEGANLTRLLVFSLGGAGIALAFYGRQASVSPLLALAATAYVVIAGIWFAAWLVLERQVSSPFSGTFGLVHFLASVALWTSAAVYGAAVLRIGVAWRGMPRWAAVATRVGSASLLGSAVAWIGDDRLGLVNAGETGPLWSSIATAGVVLNGLGWVLLGLVLVFGGERTSRGEERG